jgi:splicing factor 3B subunit 1
LGSILGALKAIVNVIGMNKMTPPIKDLLPRLTPILKNRHEKVQENCIDLVGRIADRGAEYVSAREWMRICFELLEMLKAHKKGIRRATVNTFGYIAKAIGPQDVLHTLLNNLRVQERQNRVCTTVAVAIVAETCSPFTVLPALMNEYRVPELNVQNGVLKVWCDTRANERVNEREREREREKKRTTLNNNTNDCRHCRSCSSTLVKWVRITSMP